MQLCLKYGAVTSMNVIVVPNIIGKVTCVSLSSDDTKFLKDESLTDKMVDTIPSIAEVIPINMPIGNDYYFNPRKMDLGNGIFYFNQNLVGFLVGKLQQIQE